MRVDIRSSRGFEEKRVAMAERLSAIISKKNGTYLAPIRGQDLIYSMKYQEAQRLRGGSQSGTKFLAVEAQERGIPIADLANQVIEKHEAMQAVLAENEQSRVRIKAIIDAARTDADLELARREIHALEIGV